LSNLLFKIYSYITNTSAKNLINKGINIMSINKNLTSTLFEIPGYTIVQNLGIARGVSVRSSNAFSNFWGLFRSNFGGKISTFITMCEKVREDAFNLLLQHAEQMGANAVIGIRYDANEIYPGITEIIAYGTAIIVEKAIK